MGKKTEHDGFFHMSEQCFYRWVRAEEGLKPLETAGKAKSARRWESHGEKACGCIGQGRRRDLGVRWIGIVYGIVAPWGKADGILSGGEHRKPDDEEHIHHSTTNHATGAPSSHDEQRDESYQEVKKGLCTPSPRMEWKEVSTKEGNGFKSIRAVRKQNVVVEN